MASLIRVVFLSCFLLLFCSTQRTSFFVHGEELVGERKTPPEVLLSITPTTTLVADGEEVERELRAPKRPPPPAPSRNPPPPPPPRVRSYLLSLSWPVSVCRVDPSPCKFDYAKLLPRKFTIHGLWPHPEATCPRSPIDTKYLAPYTTRLKNNWPDIKVFDKFSVASGIRFWLYEYNKHGTCIGRVGEYFEKTLNFYDGHQLATLHTRAKIVPGLGRALKVFDVEKAIQGVTGVKPILRCNKVPKTGASQLMEIRFKLNDKMQFQHPTGSSNCGTEVVFPG